MSIDVNPLVHEVLLKARDLISTPKKWTKHAFARRSNNRPTTSSSHVATKWCMVGAIQRGARIVVPEHWDVVVNETLNVLNEHSAIVKGGNTYFNDHPDTTHDKVIRVFNDTIDKVSYNMKAGIS